MPPKPVNPNEFLAIPKWVNEEYFRPILEKDVKDFDKIIEFTPIAATAPGENYASIMIRVVVDYLLKGKQFLNQFTILWLQQMFLYLGGAKEQSSYILKTALDLDKGGALIGQMEVFPKEKEMYQTHIPQFVNLYKEAGVDVELAPKSVHFEETPERITLVFEDLKRQNFSNFDRLKGFDLPHMRSVLRKLAELHAASVVYREICGPFDDKFNKNMFCEENRAMMTMIREIRERQYLKAMLEWGLPDVEKYIKKSPEPAKFFDIVLKANTVNEQDFNVLNHGDCWSNNIMFNYKPNGEIDRTLFVDLQMGKWGTPAQDLWYLIVTSASLDIKVKEFDLFIQIYQERLAECLTLLNYSKKAPTLRDVHGMMIKYGDWGPITATGVLVATLLPSDKDSNMANMLAPGPVGDALRHKTFVNSYYVNAMKQLYPFFDRKGLLD
ncbi:hypothetical protein KR018_005524 [Drosophila ironensis]|nr:hypothetical protein KR018_005524 [Drosophila ironensis]